MGFININKYIVLTFSIFGFIFWHLAKEMLKVKPGGLYVGHINLYGDLVFHLSLINKFLESNKILIDSPILAGEKVNYPIFADFITAQIAKLSGVDFALFITTFIGGLIAIFVARQFIKIFIKDERVVFLSLLIFFFNGGLGFYYFFGDFLNSQKSFGDFIFHLPGEYTDIKEKGYWWINTILAYFLPQRGFLFAFGQTLTVLGILYLGIKKQKKYFFALAGLIAGVLPLVQAHSLFLIFLLTLLYSPAVILISKQKKNLILNFLIFASLTTVLSLPLFKIISSAENPLKYFRFDPGWTSQENILWFWLKNLGLFAPMLAAAIVWLYSKNRYLFNLYLPFLIIFVVCNLFIFQPWEFDNSKLLVYWYFASSILVAYFLYSRFLSENLVRKTFGIIILLLMILSGFLDLFKTFTPAGDYQIFTKQDIEVADSIKILTAKDAKFVTAANHNHPIPALTGRSTLLGFHGWVWSHGLDYQDRARDVETIYLGGQAAADLIRKYRVSYVTIGPSEMADFSINQSYFRQFPNVYADSEWKIYDVSNLWSDGNR